jgi:hypothetical protein
MLPSHLAAVRFVSHCEPEDAQKTVFKFRTARSITPENWFEKQKNCECNKNSDLGFSSVFWCVYGY